MANMFVIFVTNNTLTKRTNQSIEGFISDNTCLSSKNGDTPSIKYLSEDIDTEYKRNVVRFFSRRKADELVIDLKKVFNRYFSDFDITLQVSELPFSNDLVQAAVRKPFTWSL